MIFGLFAAVGWGLADFGGAVVARRLGTMTAVVLSQGSTAVVMTGVVLITGQAVGELTAYLPWIVVVGCLGASAYAAHFRALRLGPVALVSPVGATYALVGLTLAVLVLGERPSAAALAGGIMTVFGVMLASADLPKLRAGTHGLPPALPFALLAALMFGVGGFILAWLSRQIGWVLTVWGARMVQVVALGVLASVVGRGPSESSTAAGAPGALAVGLLPRRGPSVS